MLSDVERNRIERALLDAQKARAKTVTIETDHLHDLLNPTASDAECPMCENYKDAIEDAESEVDSALESLGEMDLDNAAESLRDDARKSLKKAIRCLDVKVVA